MLMSLTLTSKTTNCLACNDTKLIQSLGMMFNECLDCKNDIKPVLSHYDLSPLSVSPIVEVAKPIKKRKTKPVTFKGKVSKFSVT